MTGGGTIRSRQGINLPGAKLSVASLTEADMANAIWAAKNDVDFVSLSFVRKAGRCAAAQGAAQVARLGGDDDRQDRKARGRGSSWPRSSPRPTA